MHRVIPVAGVTLCNRVDVVFVWQELQRSGCNIYDALIYASVYYTLDFLKP